VVVAPAGGGADIHGGHDEKKGITTDTPATTAPPAVPTGIVVNTLTPQPDSLTVSWDAVPGATTYEIRYRITTNAKGTALLTEKQLATQIWVTQLVEYNSADGVAIEGLIANTGYQFQVRAVNAVGKSGWSIASTASLTAKTTAATTSGADDLTKAKFSTKPKAAPGTAAVDSVTVTWGVVPNATAYVITYTIPSGMKGVSDTTVSKVLTGNELVAATSGTMVTHKIEGLKSSVSYKVSIVAKSATGTTTKAAAVTVKTVAAPAIKKVSVVDAKTKTTISSITLKVQAGTVPAGFGDVGGYIVQVYASKLKGMTEPPLVKTVFFTRAELEAATGQVIGGLAASTKYTFVVMATDKDETGALMTDGTIRDGQKLSAVKSIAASTAKYAATSGIKYVNTVATPHSLTFKVPANDKYPVGLTRPGDDGLDGGYNRYEIWVVVGTGTSATLEFRGSVGVTLTGTKLVNGKIDLAENKSLFAGLSGNKNFVIRAVFEVGDGHIVNSLDGKFKLTAAQLGAINAL
jgi:hypothetical protein